MINETLEWQNDTIAVVRLDGLPVGPKFPRVLSGRSRFQKIQEREINALYVHQTAGSFKTGHDAALALAKFAIAPPKRDADGRLIGGGRGWPGAPYPFLIPYPPTRMNGRLVVYRLWSDEWWTFHTGPGINESATAVALSGSFKTRWAPQWSESARDPHADQMVALASFVTDYAMPRYGLSPDRVRGHFEAGKKTCPGDAIEAWILELRNGGRPCSLQGGAPKAESHAELKTWSQRQAALVAMGYDVGPAGVDGIFGFDTRSAVEAFQADHDLVVDGIWGRNTERAMKLALEI